MARARKPLRRVVRKDGRPTLRERKEQNRYLFRKVQEEFSDRRAEPRKLRDVSPGDVDAVIQAVALGDTVRGKCRELCICEGTVRMRIAADDELTARYAQARVHQAHALVEQNLMDLEDLDLVDTEADGASVVVSIAKHKFDVRRWTAGKFHVGAYGDRVTQVVEGNPSRPIEHTFRSVDELRRELKMRNIPLSTVFEPVALVEDRAAKKRREPITIEHE